MEKYSSIPETEEHSDNVRDLMELLAKNLELRGNLHDASKIEEPELSYFDKYTPILKNLVYGSPEYKNSLKSLGPALKHHYENNRHHPEFFPNGVSSMNLLDIIEMFCDWIAASKRTKGGNVYGSIEKSCAKFNISDQLKEIFHNTRDALDL